MPVNLVDSHCHLDMLDLADFDHHMDNVIEQAKAKQVSDILSISVDLDTFPEILKVAKSYPNVFASVGLHPCHSPDKTVTQQELEALAGDAKVIAIGETGLDYYMHNGSCPLGESFLWQQERFRVHIRTAIATGKPLVIHTREAREDTLRILAEENASEIGGIMHCFVEDLDTAEKALAMGFYISFSGIVTFKNATAIQEVAKVIPDERILIETDAPYLAPVPMRGKKNQPAYVAYVAEFLAQLRRTSLEHIANITRENYYRLFDLSGK